MSVTAGLRCGRAAIALPLALAACIPSPAPQPAPPPPAAPAPPAPPAKPVDWRDATLSPGTWRYQPAAGGSEALFGPAGAAPLFTMRCDRARRTVILSRQGALTGQLTVRTSYAVRAWPLQAGTVALTPADPALDQIAFSRGRFSVDAPGQPTLFIPAWAEPSRVIEDCRG
jgi:hypothetical protein